MPVAQLSEALLHRNTATDGRILRDRQLSGFLVRLHARRRTFWVATSAAGVQVRLRIGHWPLISVDEARAKALELIRQCRQGIRPASPMHVCAPALSELPTLQALLTEYCKAKGIKPSSQSRYESILRCHFHDWLALSVSELQQPRFVSACKMFAQGNGAAIVDLGRGLWSGLLKFLHAVHGQDIANPFTKLAAAGLMPKPVQPRERVLQADQLPAWWGAVQGLPERQRDYLLVLLLTGLRRSEARGLCPAQIDFTKGVLSVSETKNGKPHLLPISPRLAEVLRRRCEGLAPQDALFRGVSADHVAGMAVRLGAPRFMLHDIRKLVASVGNQLGINEAVLRRILNHTPPRADVLARHYVGVTLQEVAEGLAKIQAALAEHAGMGS